MGLWRSAGEGQDQGVRSSVLHTQVRLRGNLPRCRLHWLGIAVGSRQGVSSVTVLRLCSYRGCNRRVPSGRCTEHQALDSQVRNARVKRYGYNTPHWQTLRVERIVYAEHLCELGLPGCTGRATHVHLDPSLHGDHARASLDDCRACCPSCSGAVDAPRARR